MAGSVNKSSGFEGKPNLRLGHTSQIIGDMKWPESRSAQAGVAFLTAFGCAVIAYESICSSHLREYARLYPHDGQDGLAAGVDGLEAGALTFVLVFGIALLVQRLWLSDR